MHLHYSSFLQIFIISYLQLASSLTISSTYLITSSTRHGYISCKSDHHPHQFKPPPLCLQVVVSLFTLSVILTIVRYWCNQQQIYACASGFFKAWRASFCRLRTRSASRSSSTTTFASKSLAFEVFFLGRSLWLCSAWHDGHFQHLLNFLADDSVWRTVPAESFYPSLN